MAEAARLAARGLLERGGELARVERVIAGLERGHGGVLVVQGVAGIGKSALLCALCEHATERGLQTLGARASELERDFGFGVVRQLLERRVVRAGESERAELLAGAAGLAGPVLGVGEGSVRDSFAALHGLYWLVANLALDGPVVLAVDDLQWADEPSLRWLVYLCHRLEGLAVLVAASTRPPRAGYSPLLAELLTVSGVQILCPGQLSESAVAQLVGEGLGTHPDPVFVAACARVTGGNPFVLRELIFDLAADGVAPVAAQAAGLTERVPGQVERVVLARLGRLDQTAVRLAHAVAVLGEGSELRLAAALADLEVDAAAQAADVLLSADLLAGGRPMRFVHPLVRSAVYEQLAPGARARAHARAAQLLAREGAQPEQVAVQLLACEPAGSADAVQAMRTAAAAALARGAPETAITYLSRALTEPPTEVTSAAVLGELGRAEQTARNPAAVAHLEQAMRATTCPLARARLAEQLANVLFMVDSTRSSAVAKAGLHDLADRDPDLTTRLHVHRVLVELLSVNRTDPPNIFLQPLREMAVAGRPASRWAQLTLAGICAIRVENCDEISGLIERGWDEGRFLAEVTCEAVPAILAGHAAIFIDDLDKAHALAEATLADARARGSVAGFLSAASRRGQVALRRGALLEAEADIRVALELATEHNLTFAIPIAAAALGRTLLERGNLDEAGAVVDGVTLGPTIVGFLSGAPLLETRGRVRLAQGQRAQAIADLRHCGQLADDVQLRNPNYVAWRSALALALAPDAPQEARELAKTELMLAHRAGSARATGIALRACGLLAPGEDGIQLLEQSVAILEPTPMRLELAHSLTELGAALRRAGARIGAREPLRRALDLAHRCGCTPLAERARDEALVAGARPRRPLITGVHALTPSELRVARLAAQALGNREIAQALFITTKTVSDHLTNTYRKLNISSRDQLTTALTAHT